MSKGVSQALISEGPLSTQQLITEKYIGEPMIWRTWPAKRRSREDAGQAISGNHSCLESRPATWCWGAFQDRLCGSGPASKRGVDVP